MQGISKTIAALEQKVSIINFDMELLKANLSKVCDVFSLMENAPSASLHNEKGSNEQLPPRSRTVLMDTTGRGVQTHGALEMQNAAVSASIGSKSVSSYHTPQGQRCGTPNNDFPIAPTSIPIDTAPARRGSPQTEWATSFLVENRDYPATMTPTAKIRRLNIEAQGGEHNIFEGGENPLP